MAWDGPAGRVAEPGEGLRERKKRQTREHISHVATRMFMAQGFDEVRVADVAAAAGVSEKTVYNYFDTKESLLLDLEPELAERFRAVLGPQAVLPSPIEAMLHVLRDQLDELYALRPDEQVPDGVRFFLRFLELVERTPSLRAAYRDMLDRLGQVAAAAMAERAGVDPLSPEPQVAADALMSLWRIQFAAFRRHIELGTPAPEARDAVLDEVARAARLIATGLWSFSVMVQGVHSREQLAAAARSAVQARRQVVSALRQAHAARRDGLRTPHGRHPGDGRLP